MLRHIDPVHFYRGGLGDVWICIECRKVIKGPKIDTAEVEALIKIGLNKRAEMVERRKKGE